VAFAKPPALALRAELGAVPSRVAALVRVARGAGRTYGLGADGTLGRLDTGAPALTVPLALDVAVAKAPSGEVHAFVARWRAADASSLSFELTRYTSADDGLTFDAASALAVLEGTSPRAVGAAAGETATLAFGPDGLLYVALGQAGSSPAELATIFGKVLRVDVSTGAAVVPPGNPVTAAQGRAEIWAVGVHEPRGLDVDAETGDVWLTDHVAADDTTLVHRLVRGSTEPLVALLTVAAPERRAAYSGGHVYRGAALPDLVGEYVYPAPGGALVVVDRFGPSGTAQSSLLALGAEGPLGRVDDDLVVATASAGVARIVTAAPASAVPVSLLATRCFDLAAPAGHPAGAIAYDVTTPLWSDGATKERFVVVPKGASVTARADGDLVFPVGTIAVKTFAVDGKRVETRLFVQHELEDWVGYSYAWNEAGTDAELVIGNRVKALAGGKSWYFPSRADCAACHTPAAGYTLGLEAKQLAGHGDALQRLEAKVASNVPRGGAELVAVDAPAPATGEARARSYLHANCAMCHREGSATGTVVDLDLRVDTPLAATGLCKEAQAGTLGLAKGARVVAPGDPAASVLVARMRALDERRMPKLASRVVDEAGVAAVEAWIRGLGSCP
jgi:uncharacterized repeat protein (TIGR03806 family)